MHASSRSCLPRQSRCSQLRLALTLAFPNSQPCCRKQSTTRHDLPCVHSLQLPSLLAVFDSRVLVMRWAQGMCILCTLRESLRCKQRSSFCPRVFWPQSTMANATFLANPVAGIGASPSSYVNGYPCLATVRSRVANSISSTVTGISCSQV